MSLILEISDGIKMFVDKMKEKGKERSALSILQKKTGVSYSTLRRILLKEQEPTETTVRALLPILFSKEEQNRIKSDYLKEDINECYEDVSESPVMDYFLDGDDLDLEILAWTANARGATRDEIISRSVFSSRIVGERLDKYLDSDMVEEIGGRYFSNQEFTGNVSTVRKGASLIAESMKNRLDQRKAMAIDFEVMSDDEYESLITDIDKLFLSYKNRMNQKDRSGDDLKPRMFSIVLGTV